MQFVTQNQTAVCFADPGSKLAGWLAGKLAKLGYLG